MKKLCLLLLCASSSVYAESRALPPVIDNSIYSGGSAYSNASPSSNAMYELLGRLEQMQSEIQQLRGLVEEQSQSILDLKKRQGNIYNDLDQRLQELAGGNINSNTMAEQKAINQPVVKPVENPVQENSTDSASQVVKQSEAEVAGESEKNQKQLYQDAYEILRNGHNTRAISAFKALITEFPTGEYADNSQYWLAEAFKANQDTNAAKKAFKKVIANYSNSPKVPDALLKLAYIELEQNNVAKARDYLTQVTGNYPGTTAAHLANKKLVQLGVMQP